MKFWTSENGPPPARKRKQVTSELDKHEEYLKLKAMLFSGRMRPNEMAGIYMGPDDAKKLGYKWPWRTATDSLRRLVRSMHLEADYEVTKYETDQSGVWFVGIKYNPPLVKSAQAHEVPVAQAKRAPGRPRKTA